MPAVEGSAIFSRPDFWPLPGRLLPERFDERGHVPPVLRGELVDAGDEEFPFAVTRMLRFGGDLVVVMS